METRKFVQTWVELPPDAQIEIQALMAGILRSVKKWDLKAVVGLHLEQGATGINGRDYVAALVDCYLNFLLCGKLLSILHENGIELPKIEAKP